MGVWTWVHQNIIRLGCRCSNRYAMTPFIWYLYVSFFKRYGWIWFFFLKNLQSQSGGWGNQSYNQWFQRNNDADKNLRIKIQLFIFRHQNYRSNSKGLLKRGWESYRAKRYIGMCIWRVSLYITLWYVHLYKPCLHVARAGTLGWLPWTYCTYPDLVSSPPIQILRPF